MNDISSPTTATSPENSKELPEKNGIFEYQRLLDAAASQYDGKDYSNSTTTHAEIAISKILEISTSDIGVFSTCFSGIFWNRLKEQIYQFLDGGVDRKFSVITAAPPDKDCANLVEELRRDYPHQFSFKTLKKGVLDSEENPNFLFGDTKTSRFEDNDRDAKLGLVSAIVNFGNAERVKNMRRVFRKLEEHVQ